MYENRYKIAIFLPLSVCIVALASGIGLFWDNVLFASKMGNHLYQNGIFHWDIPSRFDPGHPPFVGALMALGWTLFGKSLAVSHAMMLPFVFGLLWQLYGFVAHFIPRPAHRPWAMLLVLADPTLLSQLATVNPDVILLFFFFLALNGLLRRQLLWQILGLAGLGLVSYRGMMVCAGVFLIDAALTLGIARAGFRGFFTLRRLAVYALGGLPAIGFVSWRLIAKGWLIANPHANWGNAWGFESATDFASNFLRNAVVLAHRFLDFGRIGVLLFIGYVLLRRGIPKDWARVGPLLVIAVFSTMVVYGTSLLIRNPMSHLYYLPSFLALALLAFVLLEQLPLRRWIYAALLALLLLGHLLIYPPRIAQGWDASLAHLPYWPLRTQALRYMDEAGIPIGATASFFPNVVSIDDVNVNGDTRTFLPFTGQEPYVFYATVFNLTDEEHDLLAQHYTPLRTFRQGRIHLILYSKRE